MSEARVSQHSAPGLPPSVVALAATSLFADTSTEMLFPVLPLFLTQELGAPAVVVGAVEGLAQGIQYIAQSYSGWLADRARRNKPVALFGYGLQALAKLAMGLATTWPLVLVGRVADRYGSGTRSAPRDALIADAAGEARRGAAFGLEGIGDNLGAVIGPLLTALLLATARLPIRAFFYLAVIPAVIAFVLIGSARERRGRQSSSAAEHPRLGALPGRYWRYVIAMSVAGLGTVSSAFIILRAVNVGIPDPQTVVLYAGLNLAAAAISYPAGSFSDRAGRKQVLTASLIIPAVVYFGLAASGSVVVTAVLFVLFGIYQGALRAVGRAFATDLAPAELRASAIGMYSAGIGLSALVGNLIVGVLWTSFTPPVAFAYAGSFAFLGWLLLILLAPSA